MAWKRWGELSGYDKYMLVIGLVGKTFLVLQIATMILNESSENVSLTSYMVYFLTSLSWLVFGLLYQDIIVSVSSYIGIVGALFAMNTVVILKQNKSDIL